MSTASPSDLRMVADLAPQLDDPSTRREAVWLWNQALYDRGVIDPDYSMKATRLLVDRAFADPTLIASADLPTVRAMSTFLSRGERFCDGWLERAAENGVAAALARRLGEIASTPSPGTGPLQRE